VIRGCREGREDGTWILPEIVEAYERLHRLGHAHSLEIWAGELLAGGLYGVQRGALFSAESMFHRVRDASKAALVAAVRSLFAAGVEVFDVQLTTSHLASMGAFEVPRRAYVAAVRRAARREIDLSGIEPAFGV
jgi:leucyl/phenylalanyl-tRNA--protein transferase